MTTAEWNAYWKAEAEFQVGDIVRLRPRDLFENWACINLSYWTSLMHTDLLIIEVIPDSTGWYYRFDGKWFSWREQFLKLKTVALPDELFEI